MARIGESRAPDSDRPKRLFFAFWTDSRIRGAIGERRNGPAGNRDLGVRKHQPPDEVRLRLHVDGGGDGRVRRGPDDAPHRLADLGLQRLDGCARRRRPPR